ncbi:hypothetical protein PR048_004836 [Dryococelus australis]|uniref:Uncharacterized protein n=1 Tax=Dryococelus australis TaxID=614101 RepID=A0ABQ9I6J6_9NEOP|nr:hypothetical protein PR048_004836 [Dryococelus australis]
MQQHEFFSTQDLEKSIAKRKINTKKRHFKWLQLQWLRFNSTPNTLLYKETLDNVMEFSTLDLKKLTKGRPRASISSVDLRPLYPSPRTITAAKKKDMLELFQWIPSIRHQFFIDLVTTEDAVDMGPMSDYEDNEED